MKLKLTLLAIFVLAALALFALARQDPLEACLAEPPGPRTACFQKFIDVAAHAGEYEDAFAVVARAYALDADFAANCHGSVHEIGKAAYERFRAGEQSHFSAKAFYCGYGFYHGFMEALLSEEGDAKRAVAFCDEIGRALAEETADARGACFHGIGHGTVDGTKPELWNDPRGLVAEGLRMCELVAGTLPDIPEGTGPLYRCTTGAYNSLEILSQDEIYGLEALARDPFGFCARESSRYRGGCYTNMLPAIMRLRADDFRFVVSDIKAIGGLDDEERASLVLDLFHEYVRLHIDEEPRGKSGIALCRELREPLATGCIKGLTGGQLKYGEPEREAEGLFTFCALPLSERERAACWRYGLSRLSNFYSRDEARALCARAPEDVRGACGG